MAKKIFKYQLETTDFQQIQIPEGGEILCLQTQYNRPCIWVLVDPDSPTKQRTFEIFGTGHSLPEHVNRKYVGSYQVFDSLVFHCFELLNLI